LHCPGRENYNFGVTRSEIVFRGARLLRSSLQEGLEFLEETKKEDPVASAVLEVFLLGMRREPERAIKIGLRIIPKLEGDLETSYFLFNELGKAYRDLGRLELAEEYFQRTVEIGELIGKPNLIYPAYTTLYFNKFFREDFTTLYQEMKAYLKRVPRRFKPRALYLFAILKLILGKPSDALRILNDPVHLSQGNQIHNLAVKEIKGLAMRLMGLLEESARCLAESAAGFLELGSSYAAFPLSKALCIQKFAGISVLPEGLIEGCLSISRRGDEATLAAAKESEAYLLPEERSVPEALLGCAKAYYIAFQPLEGFLSGSTALLLAWRTRSGAFAEIANFLSPHVPRYPGFKNDPIIGDFLARAEPLVSPSLKAPRIRANLIGKFSISVDGVPRSPETIRNRKALTLLVYLLLAPKHRMAQDQIFSLLWPRARPAKSGMNRLYVNIYQLRRFLGDAALLTKRGELYQLEDVWTDLGELESLLKSADTSQNPAEKEELVSRARQLAQGELLPEFPYDKHIEEYRGYYNRLRNRL
jgi:tetratricopeptide (TPR) repeat protein